MRQSGDAWASRLDVLLEDLELAETEHNDVIAAIAAQHHRGAVNLVHDTRCRRHDLRTLQNDLMDIGATSLATTEASAPAIFGPIRPIVRGKSCVVRDVLPARSGRRSRRSTDPN